MPRHDPDWKRRQRNPPFKVGDVYTKMNEYGRLEEWEVIKMVFRHDARYTCDRNWEITSQTKWKQKCGCVECQVHSKHRVFDFSSSKTAK